MSESSRVEDKKLQVNNNLDTSVYEAMMNLAQDYNTKYLLVSGNGCVGSIDGDPPAAMRYTEAKLSPVGEMMLKDLEMDTVDMKPTYDGTENEPTVLPTLFPNLLANGSTGIAVAVSTSFAPHKVSDIYKALNLIIDKAIKGEEANEDDLIDIVKAPDFPTGGVIMNTAEMRAAYKLGRGSVIIRSKYEIVSNKNKTESIIITEIPYKVNKAKMVEQIDDLRKAGLTDIKEVRDESDKDGIRVVIDLKRGANSTYVIQNLLKKTSVQSSFPINHSILINGKPVRNCSLSTLLQNFVLHALDVVTRKTRYQLNIAQQRLEIVSGILTAMDHIDEVVAALNTAEDDKQAIEWLHEGLSLTERQAKSVIAMRMGTLIKASSKKYIAEQNQLYSDIAYYEDVLKDVPSQLKETKLRLNEMAEQFKDESRLTELANEELSSNINKKDLVKDEPVVITLTNNSLIKSVRESEYTAQRRGGKGLFTNVSEDDSIKYFINASTKDSLLFFTNKGMCQTLPVYEIPISKRSSVGKYLSNYVSFDADEEIMTVMAASDSDKKKQIMLVTKNGLVKTMTAETAKTNRSKTRVITLTNADKIKSVLFIDDDTEVILSTLKGMGIRFKASDIRPTGKLARGVRAIKFRDGDSVQNAIVVDTNKYMLVAVSNGLVKRMPFEVISTQKRGGYGMIIAKMDDKDYIVGTAAVSNQDDVLISTSGGQTIRTAVSSISVVKSRHSKGYKGIALEDDDKVISINVTVHTEEDKNDGE